MPTTPSGFWYPDRNTTVNSISGLFAQQANASEDALNNRILRDGVPKFHDAGGRDAALGAVSPAVGALVYLESTDTYEKWNGTTWVPVLGEAARHVRTLAASGLGTATAVATNATLDIGVPTSFSLPSRRAVRFSGSVRFTWSGTITFTAVITMSGVGSADTFWRSTYRSINTGDEWATISHTIPIDAGTHTATITALNYVGAGPVTFQQRSLTIEDMGDADALSL